MAVVTICSDFGTQENKVCHCFHCFPIYLPWNDGTGCHDLSFLNLNFKSAFSLSSFTFIRRLFSSSLLSALRVVSSAYLRLLTFLLAILIPVQFSLDAQSCLTLWDPMDCNTPGFPVHHELPELTQTHVHWVGDAIPPSHPLSSPSSTFNHSQHQGLFKWVSSSHQVAKVLEFQLQHQSFQRIFRSDFL